MSNTHDEQTQMPRIVKTRLGSIEYAEYGEGPAVLAVHGAMGGYDQSLILACTIGDEGFRYIAVSRPGYLGTPLASGKTPEEQADLYAALLDELGISTAIVMAVSGGGPSALHFALRHRERCRGLILVSTCGQKVTSPIPFSFRVTGMLVRWPAFARTLERKASENLEMAASRSVTDPALLARTMADPEAGPLFAALMKSTSSRMAERFPGTMNDISVTRATEYPLEQIAVPVFIAHGTADPMVPFELHAKALSSRIPGAEMLTIEGGEHACIFTHREEIRARAIRFLHEHSPAEVA